MNKADIQQLYKYNKWANGVTLKSVSALTTADLTRTLGGSFPSVRDTLVHILGAEWIWLRRWKGNSPRGFIAIEEFPGLAAVKAKWTEIEAEQMDFVNAVSEESLKEVISYVNLKGQNYKYPLGRLMQHVVNHSSYHRGQVTNFLRQLGAQPAATDFLVYFDVEGPIQP